MRLVFKKTLIVVFCLIMAFSPVVWTVKPAKAQDAFSDYGGEIAVTALGCFGILDKVGSALSSLTSSLFSGGREVPVSDGTLQSKENCLDSIAYTASKILLAKVTRSTLDWINSGFQGSPTFVQSSGTFFGSVANETVSSFTAKIAFDPNRFPFGRFTAQNIINSIQNQLDYNAQVSSGNLLNNDNNSAVPYKERFDNFTNDFLYGGGWDGYLAVTQITNANPFDSYIHGVNSVGRTVNASKNQKNPVRELTQELQQSGGFLALKKCIEPTDYEPESADPLFTRAEATAIVSSADGYGGTNGPPTLAGMQNIEDAKEWLRMHTCTRFETKTPGTAIAQQMNISLSGTAAQLVNADELNESISAIFDALIKQLFKSGVASLSGSNSNPAGSNVDVLGGYGTNTSDPTITTGGGTTAAADQWFNQNQNFNLKEAIAPGGVIDDPDCRFIYASDVGGTIPAPTNASGQQVVTGVIMNPNALSNPDCNQGYAVLQRSYAQALRAQNKKLEEAIRWIGYGDYCVPGPRPDWYQEARQAVADLQQRFSDIAQEGDEDDRARHSYAELKYFTGFAADYSDTVNLRNPSNAYNAIWQTLSEKVGGWGYRQFIEDRYNPLNPDMPVIAALINQEYARKNHYQTVITNNTVAAAEAEAMFLRLNNIYNNIVQAEIDYGIGTASANTTAFNLFMNNQLRVFSRLVSQVKTVTSINNVISDINLAEDEIKYLSDPITGLIKSCVQETQINNPISTSNPQLTRRPYPAGAKATASDFSYRGWTSGDPLSSYTPAQTFLPETRIVTFTPSQYDIYIGHYVNACGGGNVWFMPLNGSNTYAACLDHDTTLTSSTGDRFEIHINSY